MVNSESRVSDIYQRRVYIAFRKIQLTYPLFFFIVVGRGQTAIYICIYWRRVPYPWILKLWQGKKGVMAIKLRLREPDERFPLEAPTCIWTLCNPTHPLFSFTSGRGRKPLAIAKSRYNDQSFYLIQLTVLPVQSYSPINLMSRPGGIYIILYQMRYSGKTEILFFTPYLITEILSLDL